MTPKRFHELALALPAARFDLKWGGVRVFSVAQKIFAHAGMDGESAPLYAFKASPMSFDLLIESGAAAPAPYFARLGWVRVTAPDALPEDALARYLAQAHALAAEKLSRRARAALGLIV